MSIADKLIKLENDIGNAYNSISLKGGEIPANKNTENLASAIGSITGGGSFENVGTEVSIEAETTIEAGDLIVGVENDEFITPSVVSSSVGGTIVALSEDMSVGFGSATITSNTVLPMYFLNEETGAYDTYNLQLNDISSLTQYNARITTADMLINEDGSCALIGYGVTTSNINCGNSVLVIDIDKANKTATYKVLTNVIGQLVNTGTSSDSYYVNNSTLNESWIKGQTLFRNNIVIANIRSYIHRKDTGAYYNSGNALAAFRYTGDGFECIYNDPPTVGSSTGRSVLASANCEENEIAFVLKTNSMMLYSFNTETNSYRSITYLSGSAVSDARFSKNAKYLMSLRNLYSVSYVDLSMTLIKAISYVGAPSSDGNLIATAQGIYDSNNTKVYSINAIPTNGFFEPSKWVSGGTIYSIVPSTTAEYLVSKIANFTMESQKMYGIANEDLVVGETGTAQMLFNTY